MEESKYTRVTEAEMLIAALYAKYPKVLWTIKNPQCVAVLGIENKDRPKTSRVLATIQKIPTKMKALMIGANTNITHVIELYWSDWHKWSVPQRQVILFHECLHVPPMDKGVYDHDVKDFKVILDALGLGYLSRTDLPDLLKTDVAFDENLVPGTIEETMKAKNAK